MQAVTLAPWAFLFVFLGSSGLPLGVPPLPETQLLSKIAPEECLFYASSSGMAAPDSKSTNQTEQLLAEPELQKAVGEIEKMIRGGLSKSMDQNSLPPGVTSDEVVDLVKMLLTRPMAVYVSDIQMGPEGPNIRGAAAIKIGDDAEKLKTKLEELTKTLPPQMVETRDINGDKFQSIKIAPNASIVWGFKKNFFLAAMGDGEMEALLKRAGGNAPKWFAKIRQDLLVERVSTVGFVNVKAIVKIFVPMAGPQGAVIVDALGLSNVDNISTVGGLDQSNYVRKLLISIDGEPQGLMRFSTIKPLSPDDLGFIPAGAAAAMAVKINPSGIFDAYMETVQKIDPQAAMQIQNGINFMESQLGLKLREEILASFGDTLSFYSATGASGAPEGIIVLQVKDSQAATKTFSKIMQIVEMQLQEAAQRSPIPVKFEHTNISGKEAYTISVQQPGMPPVQPTICLTDKELIVAASQQGVQAYMSRSQKGDSLAKSPDIAKLFSGGDAPTALAYCNAQQACDNIYASLPLASIALLQQGIQVDMSKLPPKETIRGHLTPLVSSVRRTKLGIEITERTPIPGITNSTPMLLVFLLPGVQSGREAARRAASINNMKGIMLAMHNYHDAKKSFPPAYKADKDGKPLLSWRVLILPLMEYGDLYKEFNLDEPWDSEHNKKLIAKMPAEYRSPSSNAGAGKTNYLTVRGENTVFPGKQGVRMADITDGTAFTIAIVEAADEKAVIWSKPDDFEIDNQNPLKGLAGLHPSVILAGFADGSVHTLSAVIDPEVLRGLFSRNGGEAVQGKF